MGWYKNETITRWLGDRRVIETENTLVWILHISTAKTACLTLLLIIGYHYHRNSSVKRPRCVHSWNPIMRVFLFFISGGSVHSSPWDMYVSHDKNLVFRSYGENVMTSYWLSSVRIEHKVARLFTSLHTIGYWKWYFYTVKYVDLLCLHVIFKTWNKKINW